MKMKNRLLLSFFLSFIFISSCKKQDKSTTGFVSTQIDLLIPNTQNKSFLRIAEALKMEDKITHFFERFTLTEGLIDWNGALIYTNSTTDNNQPLQSITKNIDTLIFVPLVISGTKYINAFLVGKLKGKSIELHLVSKRNYAKFGYTKNDNSISADMIAKQFMRLEYSTFSHDSFLVKDLKLFNTFPKSVTKKPFIVRLGLSDNTSNYFAIIAPSCEGFWYSENGRERDCVSTYLWTFGNSGTSFGNNNGGNGGTYSGSSGGNNNGGNGGTYSGSGGGGNGGSFGNDADCKNAIIQGRLKPCSAYQNNNEPSGWEPINYDTSPFHWSFTKDDGTLFRDNNPLTQPTFKFDPADNYQTKYPRFTNMVKNLKTFIIANPVVMAALQKYSGFTKQQIIDKVTFGKGPIIKVIELEGIYGNYDSKVNLNILNLRASYVRGLEQSFLPSTQQATAFLLAVSILHEFVHYGTTTNHKSEGIYDFGFGFERDAFNVYVEENNAATIMIKFKKLP